LLLGHLKPVNIAGIAGVTAYLMIMSPPVWWAVQRVKTKAAAEVATLATNFLEIIGFTGILYFNGGLRGLWLSPIYVVLIIYVGISGPAHRPFVLATLCGICASAMVWLEYAGILPSRDPNLSPALPGDVQAAMIVTCASFLYVAAAVAAYLGRLIQGSQKRLQQKTADLEEKTGRLQAVQDQLIRQQQCLEERVAERTVELSAANAKLADQIAERKQAEDHRLEMERRLQQAQKAESLGRMAGAIAHHFHNLLCGVIGNLEMSLEDICARSKSRRLVENALSCSQRASDVSRLMLTYLGHDTGSKEPVDLCAVGAEALAQLAASTPPNITLTTSLPNQGLWVMADAGQIRQVLASIVINATEAAGEARSQITVSAGTAPASDIKATHIHPVQWQPSHPVYAWLTVADTSGGMAPDTLDKVFDPFFSTKFTGRGLGLAVVLGVVKAHEGSIAVESQPGRGTVFRIFIPMISRPETLTEPVASPARPAARPRLLVLVVDDEEAVREMGEVLVASLGHDVVTARDGVDALDVFAQRGDGIGCVVLDISMPRLDGWETLVQLRRVRPDLPIVMVSGYERSQAMDHRDGANEVVYLHKPFTRHEMAAAIDKAMGLTAGTAIP